MSKCESECKSEFVKNYLPIPKCPISRLNAHLVDRQPGRQAGRQASKSSYLAMANKHKEREREREENKGSSAKVGE